MLPAKSLVNYGYRVVFYDQVGSGLSQRFNENCYDKKNIDEIYLNELKGVIDHYKTSNNQKVILLGHSWGAVNGWYKHIANNLSIGLNTGYSFKRFDMTLSPGIIKTDGFRSSP